MLYNHGWEKQQTQRPKGSGPKKGQAGKETHQKKSCHGSKGPYNAITKNVIVIYQVPFHMCRVILF